MRTNNKRSLVIDAAIEVVGEKGANHLTIDAVAAQAGFSKGGVLYHFPSKRALLLGMVERLIEGEEARINDSGTAAVISMLLTEPDLSNEMRHASLAIVAAAAEDSELLSSAREHVDSRVEAIKASASEKDDAMVLFFANEGIRFLELLNLNPLTRRQTGKVLSRMAEQAERLL